MVFAMVSLFAAGQETDDNLDFLFTFGKPSTAPATRAVIPQTKPAGARLGAEARKGVMLLSSGEKIEGFFATTAEKPLRVFDGKEYHDIAWDQIASLEAKILWERDEKEWKFVEGGSDIKEYTGKTYPARELEYVVTLVNGQHVTGGVVAPVYHAATRADPTQLQVLNKRQKGEVGEKLKDLVYIKKIDLE